MASINTRNGLLYIDFRYKGVRCREYTKLADTPAHRKRLGKVLERLEAEITLGSFVYRNYFPDSPKADLFEKKERRLEVAARDANHTEQPESDIPTFADFMDTWLMEKQVEWRESHYC